jgi:hypothetical protein
MNRNSFVVACFLAFFLSTSFNSCGSGKVTIMDGQSPVRVLGGSTKIRAKKLPPATSPWTTVANCTGCIQTTKSYDTSQIFLEDVQLTVPKTPWSLTIHARRKNGDADETGRGVLICTNYDQNGTCVIAGTLAASTTITVIPQPYNAGADGPSLQTGSDSDGQSGFDYHDPKCNAAGGEKCEHPGKMIFSHIMDKKICISAVDSTPGKCTVRIGPLISR